VSKDIKVITIQQKLELFSDVWSPKIIAELNNSYVKLAKMKGEYVWHQHDDEDEMFLVLSGNLKIELQDQVLQLTAGQLVVIPKGVQHRPVAVEEVTAILVELKSTLSTGNAVDTKDKNTTHGTWI
tara:strand:- start:1017 stop:1394 length:378 start_codon:yes stop_codon:yes gene_type:complete